MIESRNLFKLESKLGGIPVKAIEKDYVLSWILIGIAKSKLFDTVCFKGGTALKKFYFSDYRFSEDLDFTLLKNISIENLEKMLEEVYEHILELVNIRLALKSKETHINSYTFYINFSGPLGADLARGEIKIDFTIKEKLINQPIIKTLLQEYDEYHDIPEDIKFRLYSLEEIFMEKILSILDPSRKEPRDIYDLWYLISNECLEFQDLCEQIKKKGIYKGLTSFEIHDTLLSKEANYNRLWTERLAIHMMELPPFERVYRELKRYLKPLNLKLV
jgi:predicted nucleotidyltransferase component of viral defense system